MSGEKTEGISRREFLKKALTGIVAMGFTSSTSCSPLKREIHEKSEKPEFLEVSSDASITLFEGNTIDAKEIWIEYFGLKDKLKIRLESGDARFLPFQPGAKRVRALGEITEPRIRRVDVDRDAVAEGYNVGVYTTPNGYRLSDFGRTDFPEGEEIYGIPVIVGPCNYFPDTSAPEEENSNTPSEKWQNVSSFGHGYFVGRIQKVPGDKNQFISLGYVCDARALKVIG